MDKELEDESLAIVRNGEAVVVYDQASLEHAAQILSDSARMAGVIEAFFKPLKEKAYAAHKAICAAEKEKLEPHKKIREYLNPQVTSFLEVQKAIREAEESRILREIEDSKISMAASAEASGNSALAEAILEAPSYAPTLSAPKVEGIQSRKELEIEVFDPLAFFKAVGSGLLELNVATINESYLKSEYRNKNRSFPGVNFRYKQAISVSKK